jgi:hypothetical protein
VRTTPTALAALALTGLVTTALPSPAAGTEPTAPRVRPGLTYTSGTTGCSFAFLFRGSDGRDYVATAGHCALPTPGRTLWRGDTGPRVTDDQGLDVGRFAFADDRDTGDVATDLAFIRLDRGLRGNPQMCAWGGPTGLLTSTPTTRTELHHNGGGQGTGETIPSRTAYADELPRTHRLRALGVVSFGDSGSGTTTAAGEAVGINVTIQAMGSGGGTAMSVSTMGMQRLDLAVAEAAKALGVRLALRTAPLLPTPLPTDRC